MHESKEILANEIGVIFNDGRTTVKGKKSNLNKDDEGDPALVSTEGTVDGGKFKFSAAHFEWLLKMGKHIDLGFNDIGRRKQGTKSTLFFCDELYRLYGSDDYETA
jgi:hypothetical protein